MEAAGSKRKRVVEACFDGFRHGDHEAILACLADDVIWDTVGFRRLHGRAELDSESSRSAPRSS